MFKFLKKPSVYRVVVELTVIVIGVLVAIAIDSWWQGVQDQELELEALSSLETDLDSAEYLLKWMVQRDKKIIKAATQLTQDGALSLRSQRGSELNPLFHTAPRVLRLRTYDELNETGNLRLISNRELRLLLTDFDSQARNLAGFDRQMEIQWNQTSRPVLYRVFSLELFEYMKKPRLSNEGLMQPTELDLLEMYNAIVDRANFASSRLFIVESLLSVLVQLQEQTSISPDTKNQDSDPAS